jgi:cell division protein FtsI (penicillin-binding protein 3)
VIRAPSRLTLIGAGFVVAALAVLARAGQLQIAQGERWRARAQSQQTSRVSLPSRRGAIYDRNGLPLALTHETYGVGLAPREVRDRGPTAALVARATGGPREAVEAALRSGRVWVEWPGPYQWSDVAPLSQLRGVYLRRRLERFYPRPEVAARLIGRVDQRGRGASGLERALDTLLAGKAGMAIVLRDHLGRTYPSPSRPVTEPVDGADVHLTVDAELQEIAERALREAVRDAGASGGDVVILQPATGEVLALAGVRNGSQAGLGAVSHTFEPGSTAKIFAAAALLRERKASTSDTVNANGGRCEIGSRVIHDEHPLDTMSLGDVIRLSSNCGIALLSRRLTAEEQFEALRDFGFGTPSGIEFPGETPGRLRHPRSWTAESPASLAMGYELAVTPLQLAAAYAVFANGGVLYEPTLVRAVRGAGGAEWRRHRPRPVRRVVSPEVAARLAHLLRGAVEAGTGRRAALSTYAVAGKTGTARRTVGGRYLSGRYAASFVGLFPAVEPQLVLLVKIDDPSGDYFGGATAAPVTRIILEAALATPGVTLDRGRLSRRRVPGVESEQSVPDGERAAAEVSWPVRSAGDGESERESTVPAVAGLTLRQAARVLHRSGFRVRIEGSGRAGFTTPAAGSRAREGTVVVIHTGVQRAS